MKVPTFAFSFYEQVYPGMWNTLTLTNCLEIAFTSKDEFCIPAVVGVVALGTPESISMALCSEVRSQAGVWH